MTPEKAMDMPRAPMSTGRGDHPLHELEEDRFSFAGLSKEVAASLRKLGSDRGAVVVGIGAPWGSGKSTFLNFLARAWEQEDPNAPLPVRFDPWWFESTEGAAHEFLVELSAFINARRSWFWRTFRPIRAGNAAQLLTSVPYIGGGLVAYRNARAKNRFSLLAIKQRLERELRKLSQPCLCLIDDVDRLSAEELLALFRLLKGLGDLPNLVAVIAADHARLDRQLEAAVVGEQFSDKIVQSWIALPLPTPQMLREQLATQLAEASPVIPGDEEERALSWTLVELLGTPRQVTRLGAAHRMATNLLNEKVNTVDVLIMEALRLSAPNSYGFVRDNFGRLRAGWPSTGEKWTAALEQVEKGSRTAGLILLLFPALGRDGVQRPIFPPLDEKRKHPLSEAVAGLTYFGSGLDQWSIHATDVDVLSWFESVGSARKVLRAFAMARHPSGLTGAHQVLERLAIAVKVASTDQKLTVINTLFELARWPGILGTQSTAEAGAITSGWRHIRDALRAVASEVPGDADLANAMPEKLSRHTAGIVAALVRQSVEAANDPSHNVDPHGSSFRGPTPIFADWRPLAERLWKWLAGLHPTTFCSYFGYDDLLTVWRLAEPSSSYALDDWNAQLGEQFFRDLARRAFARGESGPWTELGWRESMLRALREDGREAPYGPAFKEADLVEPDDETELERQEEESQDDDYHKPANP